ncbi:hypothetical protein L1887_51316 [Cichorium endivia]|nr:hypothetical protein L1887_51316 [Cichorium endivia]
MSDVVVGRPFKRRGRRHTEDSRERELADCKGPNHPHGGLGRISESHFSSTAAPAGQFRYTPLFLADIGPARASLRDCLSRLLPEVHEMALKILASAGGDANWTHAAVTPSCRTIIPWRPNHTRTPPVWTLASCRNSPPPALRDGTFRPSKCRVDRSATSNQSCPGVPSVRRRASRRSGASGGSRCDDAFDEMQRFYRRMKCTHSARRSLLQLRVPERNEFDNDLCSHMCTYIDMLGAA